MNTVSWERPQTRLAHLLPGHGIRDGHTPTLGEIRKLVKDLECVHWSGSEPGSVSDKTPCPWQQPEDSTWYAKMWLDAAPPEALNPLLACLDEGEHLYHEPDDELDEELFFEPVQWLLMLLINWGSRHPQPWAEEMGARLHDPRLRLSALCVLGARGLPEAERHLVPWARRVGELTKTEILLLAEGLEAIGTKSALALMKQLPH